MLIFMSSFVKHSFSAFSFVKFTKLTGKTTSFTQFVVKGQNVCMDRYYSQNSKQSMKIRSLDFIKVDVRQRELITVIRV